MVLGVSLLKTWPAWRGVGLGLALAVLLLAALAWPAAVRAAPQPLDDAELASVSGSGVGLAVHLALNTDLLSGAAVKPNVIAGFGDSARPVYLILHGFGGVMDLYALTLNLRHRADGSDYLDFGLPSFVGFDHFGVRAMTVQTDTVSAPTPANNYGGLLINGNGTMTGHFYMWAR